MAWYYYPFTVQVVASLTDPTPLSSQPEDLAGKTFRYPIYIRDSSSPTGGSTSPEVGTDGTNYDEYLSWWASFMPSEDAEYLQFYITPRSDSINNASGPVDTQGAYTVDAIKAIAPSTEVIFPGGRGQIYLITMGTGSKSFRFCISQPEIPYNAVSESPSQFVSGYTVGSETVEYAVPAFSTFAPWPVAYYDDDTRTNTWGEVLTMTQWDGGPVVSDPAPGVLKVNGGYWPRVGATQGGAFITFGLIEGSGWWDKLAAFYEALRGIDPVSGESRTEDPFAKGGYSAGHVGGGGDFDTSSDPIPVPDLPSSDVLTCGMFRLYMPTAEQVKEFSDYLWSENFVIDNVKKLFNDPMQSILGLSVVPAQAGPNVSETVSFNGISTGVTMPRVTYEYVAISCGSIDVSEFWGAYLDYAPYTSFQLYLPYIGIRPLAVDDVMGGSLSVTYHVNVITGACVCFVSCGDRVLYTYSGSCATEIPVTASNWTSAITGAINIAASIGSMVASGGATAPLAVANMAGTAANQLKPQVEKSGAMSGGAAILGIQYPYLIITRPIQCVPEEQNAYTGYPAFVTVTLGNETGWTVVQSIHLDGVSCTAAEKDEVMNLLTTGVIIA